MSGGWVNLSEHGWVNSGERHRGRLKTRKSAAFVRCPFALISGPVSTHLLRAFWSGASAQNPRRQRLCMANWYSSLWRNGLVVVAHGSSKLEGVVGGTENRQATLD